MVRKRKPSGRKGAQVGQRKTRRRNLRARFLIICEGKKTEPYYFDSFHGVSVSVKTIGTGLSTVGLVDYAKRWRDEAKRKNEEFTDVWVVFDKDEFTNEDFQKAIRLAEKYGMSAAYSNPSFELWYLLHFEYRDSAIDRKTCIEALSKQLGKRYDKKSVTMRDELLLREQDAIERAQKLHQSYHTHNPAQDNPCTTVYQLVKELNKHSR